MTKMNDGIYLIKPGELIREGDVILYASSSVVLLDDEFPILVDTGLKGDWGRIKRGIEEEGFRIRDIEMVINTHLHRDHCGCNEFFDIPKYAHEMEIERLNSPHGYFPYKKEVSERIRIIETPGHSYGHISVVYRGKKTFVVAGDAIPRKNNYIQGIPPRIHVDRKKAVESMKMIGEIGDVIIPGHDEAMEGRK
ncbi:MAG: MBL fold metallo-hydrolase [Candidatus Syntropharchaeia archaeon]